MTDIQSLLERARLVEPAPPSRRSNPPQALRVASPGEFDQAAKSVIAQTGLDDEPAHGLVSAVLSPFMIIAAEPVPSLDTYAADNSDDPLFGVINRCGWAYLRKSGKTAYCDLMDHQEEPDGNFTDQHDPDTPGFHEASYAGFEFHQGDPRAFRRTELLGERA